MLCRQRYVLVVMCLVAIACVESTRAEQSTATTARETSSKIWVGRYQEIEEYLRTAECLRIEEFGYAVRRCVLRPGGPVARMVWRLLPPGVYGGFFTSYKTEIAAYELDRLLKMDMVPPTVERQLQGNTGAATLWVENLVAWKDGAPPGEANRAEWNKQLARMTMFDALIDNRDRNQGNKPRDPAWNLILLDHERAFGPDTELSRPLGRIDRDYWARVLALTRKELDARLGPWLDKNQITAILARREKMKAEIDRLIVERGEAAVGLR